MLTNLRFFAFAVLLTPWAMVQAETVFNVRDFGATGNGKTIDTKSIQSAIEAASRSGGGVVLLPPGTYLSGSIRLKSHVDLRLEANCTLLGSASRSDYQKGRWYALVLADRQEDIAISGSGTIDGQGAALAQDVIRRVNAGEISDPMIKGRPDAKERPLLIELRNCRRVRVTGVTLRDSSCWVQNYIECENLTIDGIRVNSTAYWHNDGLDITDSKHVRVTHVDVNSADDGICLKSNQGGTGSDDIEVADCRIRSSASAFKLGTASNVGFHNIRVHGLTIYDTFRSAVAIESVDGAALEHIRIEGIRATNTGNAFFLRLGKRKTSTGKLEDVLIRDMKVDVPAGKPDAGYPIDGPVVSQPHNPFPSVIAGMPDHPVRNVVFEDIEIVHPGGGKPGTANVPLAELKDVPEQTSEYPEFSMFGELPAWGVYMRHAEGIEFRNFRVRIQQKDFRPAMVFDDVRDVHLNQVDLGSLSGAPVIVLNNVHKAEVKDVRYPVGSGEKVRLTGGSTY
jgi:polygalacturonase